MFVLALPRSVELDPRRGRHAAAKPNRVDRQSTRARICRGVGAASWSRLCRAVPDGERGLSRFVAQAARF